MSEGKQLDANEKFEAFAETFYKKYGYLPLGKDDRRRPTAEKILADLMSTSLLVDQLVEALKLVHRQRPLRPVCGNDGDDGIYKMTLTGRELRSIGDVLKAAGEV